MIKYESSKGNHCTQCTWNDIDGFTENSYIVRLQKKLANWNQSIVAQTNTVKALVSHHLAISKK